MGSGHFDGGDRAADGSGDRLGGCGGHFEGGDRAANGSGGHFLRYRLVFILVLNQPHTAHQTAHNAAHYTVDITHISSFPTVRHMLQPCIGRSVKADQPKGIFDQNRLLFSFPPLKAFLLKPAWRLLGQTR